MKDFEYLFKKYAQPVMVQDGSFKTAEYKAFVQPLRYKNKMYLSGYYSEMGHYGEGYYLYVGPASVPLKDLSATAILKSNGINYNIYRTEMVTFKNSGVYVWAIIKEEPRYE